MSHVDMSPLTAYNSLSDRHLAGYFANTKMRTHLRKSGLITRRGHIVPETDFRLNMARKEHKKHVKDLLAQAIVHKTLDFERNRQVAIRSKLEEIAKIEMVQRIKAERKHNRMHEAILPLLTPRKGDDSPRSTSSWNHNPTPRSEGHREDDVLIEHRNQRARPNDEDVLPLLTPRSYRPVSGPSPHSHRPIRSAKYRPISAPPSNMPNTNYSLSESYDEDVTYVDDDGNTIDMSECEQSTHTRGRPRTPRNMEEIDASHLYSLSPAELRRYATTLARMEQTNSLISPYMMPQVPIPPSSARSGGGTPRHRSAGRRGRSTSSEKSPKRHSAAHSLHRPELPMRHQGEVHSLCEVKMKYHGWALHLAREEMDPRQEVLVEQQHCGGNTLIVFRERIEPGTTFTFMSKRHRGYPFSLTLYVDGRQDARVSTCCEFGHSTRVRLGGKAGHFSIISVNGLSPCYKCQVRKGLKGGKAPPKKLRRPAKDTGEEVIVMETTSKETPTKYESKGRELSDDDDASNNVLVPVEPEGEKAPDTETADVYESDFEDEEDETPRKDKHPDEDSEGDEWHSSTNSCSSTSGNNDETTPTDIAIKFKRGELTIISQTASTVISVTMALSHSSQQVLHTDQRGSDRSADRTYSPIQELDEEKQKREIRGMTADFADEERGEKNAKVSAEKAASPMLLEDYDMVSKRKVEGYSSEEEDLEGERSKTIEVEKNKQAAETPKRKRVNYDAETKQESKDDDVPVVKSKDSEGPPARTTLTYMDEDRDDDYSSSSSESSMSSLSSKEEEIPMTKSPTKAVQESKTSGNVSSDNTTTPTSDRSMASDGSLPSSFASTKTSDTDNRPAPIPERPRSPVAVTLMKEEEEEDKQADERPPVLPSKTFIQRSLNKEAAQESPRSSSSSSSDVSSISSSESKPAELAVISKKVKKESSDYSSFSSETDDTTPRQELIPIKKEETPVVKTQTQMSSSSLSTSESEKSTPRPSNDETPTRRAEPKEVKKPSISSSSRSSSSSSSSSDSSSDSSSNSDSDEKSDKPSTKDTALPISENQKIDQSAAAKKQEEEEEKKEDPLAAFQAFRFKTVASDSESESDEDETEPEDKKTSKALDVSEHSEEHVVPKSSEKSREELNNKGETASEKDASGKSKEAVDDAGEKVAVASDKLPKKSDSSDSMDSSSDSSSSSSGTSSSDESESEGELIVQQETPRKDGDKADKDADKDADKAEDKAAPVVTVHAEMEKQPENVDQDGHQTADAGDASADAAGADSDVAIPTPPKTPPTSPDQGKETVLMIPRVEVTPMTPIPSDEHHDKLTSEDNVAEEEGQGRASESELDTMHGGNDPDNVADSDSDNWRGTMEFAKPPEQVTFQGTITPLLDGRDAIEIHNINLTRPQLMELLQSIEMRDDLSSISISNSNLGVDELDMLMMSMSKSPSKPTVLNLNYNIMGPRSVTPLVEILKIKPSIEMLLLQGNPIGNDGLQTLVDGLLDIEFEAQEYKKRETERHNGAPFTLPRGRFCQLRELDLGEASITDEGMVDVALLLESNLDLQTLSLSSSPDITQPGWIKLAASMAKNKKLKTLTLDHNKVEDAGVRVIAEGLKNNLSLATLDLADSGIGEEGGKHLIELLKKNTTILDLTLSPGNNIPHGRIEEINRYLSLNRAAVSSPPT